ncbi:17861_t:CDS:10 [Cetraspora pellucida]|uniref:17861_t:CDS:1 n=1 Tax=Cetraspora pellucida TaxID=1433469 RepID=A0ACA9LIR0_9GLOM|nr:17861_t:CDS:10 [Cetraspora pellucida]
MLNLLGKIYKNEPKSLLIFRLLVIVASIGLFIAILIVLSIEMHNENPNISTAFATPNRLPLPNIYFSYERNFTIECSLENISEQSVNDCSNFISKTIYVASQPIPYQGAFLPNYDVTPRTGIIMIDLDIFIMDPAYNKSNQNSSMPMVAFDKGKIFLNYKDISLLLYEFEYDPYFRDPSILTPFDESLLLKNMYLLSQPTSENNVYYWRFTRIIKYNIIPDFLSYFGKIRYFQQPYIESNMQTVSLPPPTTNQTNGTFYATLRFPVTTNTYVKEEKEQKSKTVLSLLGILGGIWSAIIGFYVFLFGLGLISPWGFAQKLKPFRNQYEKNLLPFTMDSQSDELDTEEKSDIKEDGNALILKRLDNLEKSLQFYKEYVLDTSFLPSVKKDTSLTIEK